MASLGNNSTYYSIVHVGIIILMALKLILTNYIVEKLQLTNMQLTK